MRQDIATKSKASRPREPGFAYAPWKGALNDLCTSNGFGVLEYWSNEKIELCRPYPITTFSDVSIIQLPKLDILNPTLQYSITPLLRFMDAGEAIYL
jgi:hypothetical protein